MLQLRPARLAEQMWGNVIRFLDCEATATRGARRPGRTTVSTTEYWSEAAPERGCPPRELMGLGS